MKTLTFKTHRNANIQAKLLQRFIDNNPGVTVEFTAENNDFAPDFEMDAKLQRRFDTDQDLHYYGVGPLWFCAKVVVTYKSFEATEYLGGCSYNSYKEFKQDAYYYDMVSMAVDQINSEITALNNAVCLAFKTRQLKRAADLLGFIVIPKTAIV